MKAADRKYHYLFGWCRIVYPPIKGSCLVDLEASSISYYVIGKGYVTHTRDANGQNILYTRAEELFDTDEPTEVPSRLALKKAAMNPIIKS